MKKRLLGLKKDIKKYGLFWAVLYNIFEFIAEDYPIIGLFILPVAVSVITTLITLKLLVL